MAWIDTKDELLRRVAADQQARHAVVRAGFVGRVILPGDGEYDEFKRLVDAIAEVDRDNQRWFTERLDTDGWPVRSEVGDDGAKAAWLIAQHADGAATLQRRCLDLASQAPPDEVDTALLAMLTDRVMLHERGVQRYGTQWETVDGEWRPKPLEDPPRVKELRAAAGLDTLDENHRRIAGVYGRAPAAGSS